MAPVTSIMDILPSPTIYVKNLNDSIKKDELRRTLYGLFSQYGGILDIVASKSEKMRGQAFIVFKDVGAASNAMRSMQSFPLYDKKMVIQFAKVKSHATMREEGTLVKFLAKRRKTAKQQANAKAAAESSDDNPAPAAKAPKTDTAASSNGDANAEPQATDEAAAEPNNIVYCSNLPAEASKDMLQVLFQQINGLVEVRLVDGRPDIAFVEFDGVPNAQTAVTALDGFQLDETHKMRVTFAKK